MKKSLVQQVREMKSLTYREVFDRYQYGEISESLWKVYRHFWAWGATRFAGSAGLQHDLYYATFGKERYYQRINSCRKVMGDYLYRV